MGHRDYDIMEGNYYKGDLLVSLSGKKLGGSWHLIVRTRGSGQYSRGGRWSRSPSTTTGSGTVIVQRMVSVRP
jgi:hypothetical protein